VDNNETGRFHAASIPLPDRHRRRKEGMPGIIVLGPVRVVADDGRPAALASRRQCLLLAMLVSRVGRVVTADNLVDALWGAALPDHPTAALQSQVFRLRRHLRSVGVDVDTDGAGYRLAAGSDRIDATLFEQLTARAEASGSEPAVAVGLLDEALALWRGSAYFEVADHPAVQPEATRLDELRADAAEQRAHLLLQLGDPNEVALAMEVLMSEHPLRERPVALRMRALARTGRHAEAVRVYQSFRRNVLEELGLEPSHELRDVEGEIVRHEWSAPPRIGVPGNSLVGREVDLSETVARLAVNRLVTLTGPGGVGKSRLALHTAARASSGYRDGLWLCELASVAASDEVVATVASVLQLQRRVGDTMSAVVQFLGTRQALLVLDNCEHVVDGVRELITAVLGRAPDVDIIATSRQRLGVEGEVVLPVAPLPIADWDDADSPAVALFVDRAKGVRPEFTLTAESLTAVCDLCRRVGGLPLAIELAASRMRSRTPVEVLADVAERIDRLGDPLRATGRHRSIEAVVSSSYESLDRLGQQVFQVVAVFAGGFTAGAAAAVADLERADTVGALSSLVERSLLGTEDAAGVTRFSMLEPVRQYAQARLGEAGSYDDVRGRHARWAAEWIEAADTGLRSAEEARWAPAIAAELSNLRVAHQWARDHDRDTAVRIAGAMFWYAAWYGAAEAFEWATAIIESAEGSAGPALARAYATAALGAARRGDMVGARALAERGIAAGDHDVSARFAWEALSSTEMMSGNYEHTLECQQHAFELAGRAGDTTHQARELAARALALGYLGQLDAAEIELDSATEMLAANATPSIQGFCSYVAGELRIDADPAAALPLLEHARDIGRGLGNRYLVAIAGVSAVSCAARIGHPAHNLGDYAELLEHFDRTGSRAQQWTTIRTLIETLARQAAPEVAATLYGALTASQGAPPLIGPDAIRMDEAVVALRTRLGEQRYGELLSTGAALGDEAAIAYARRCTTGESTARGAGTAISNSSDVS
jgi:predicted ATPase/DNA-binding SARP family transcriptional activator